MSDAQAQSIPIMGRGTMEGKAMTKRPGKFEGCSDQDLGETLHGITLDGGCDEELGDVQDFGWYGLIIGFDNGKGYIVSEDNQGFFDYEEFPTYAAAEKAWAGLEKEYETFCKESEGA